MQFINKEYVYLETRKSLDFEDSYEKYLTICDELVSLDFKFDNDVQIYQLIQALEELRNEGY